jgi:hypothetical protein
VNRSCVRIAATTGKRCRLSPIWFWPEGTGLPDPRSCRRHLTDDERAALAPFDAESEARSAEYMAVYDAWWLGLINSDPACWSWPLPTDDQIDSYIMSFSAETRGHLGDARSLYVWGLWHAGRCAICGRDSVLINDHDHRTGLMRGKICQGCNTLEGCGHGGVFAKYRERNPASISGVLERYWNPFTQEFAVPATPAGDPWLSNPMRGIGL